MATETAAIETAAPSPAPVTQESTTAPAAGSVPVVAGASPVTAPVPGEWFAKLPAEMQSDPALVPFKGKTETDLAKSLSSAQKLVSSSIRLPTEKDTSEQRAAKLDDIANKIGRPATFEGYQITPPVLPESVRWDPAQAEAFRPVAHSLRLTQEQVTGLVQWQAQQTVAAHQAIDTQRTNWQADLTKEWGHQYPQNKALAIRGLTEYGGRVLGETEAKTLLDLLDSTGLGDYPPLIKIFAALGAEHNEGHLVVGETGSITGESIDAEIAKIQKLPEFLDARHAQHEAVMAKYLGLFQRKTNSVAKAMQ